MSQHMPVTKIDWLDGVPRSVKVLMKQAEQPDQRQLAEQDLARVFLSGSVRA
jgi:hypothetical protein